MLMNQDFLIVFLSLFFAEDAPHCECISCTTSPSGPRWVQSDMPRWLVVLLVMAGFSDRMSCKEFAEYVEDMHAQVLGDELGLDADQTRHLTDVYNIYDFEHVMMMAALLELPTEADWGPSGQMDDEPMSLPFYRVEWLPRVFDAVLNLLNIMGSDEIRQLPLDSRIPSFHPSRGIVNVTWFKHASKDSRLKCAITRLRRVFGFVCAHRDVEPSGLAAKNEHFDHVVCRDCGAYFDRPRRPLPPIIDMHAEPYPLMPVIDLASTDPTVPLAIMHPVARLRFRPIRRENNEPITVSIFVTPEPSPEPIRGKVDILPVDEMSEKPL